MGSEMCIRDSCRECRGRAGHLTGCPRQNDPWPTIQVHREPTPTERAQQTILAYLSAIAEDEASVEAAAKGMAIDQDGEGAWPHDWDRADQDQYRNLARAALAVLLERAKEGQG